MEPLEELRDILNGQRLHWSSIGLFGFRKTGVDDNSKRVVILVTVYPDSVSVGEAHRSGGEIVAYLKRVHSIEDVFVEFAEAERFRSVGPALLPTLSRFDPTAAVRRPLTTVLGLPISIFKEKPQGTFGLYVKVTLKDKKTTKFGGITTRHVVLHPVGPKNTHYDYHASAPPKYVQLLGDRYYEETFRRNAGLAVRDCTVLVKDYEREITQLKASENTGRALERVESRLKRDLTDLDELEEFHAQVVNKEWKQPKKRLIGRPFLSPKLSYDNPYTEDWAYIELDKRRFAHFKCNGIDLDVNISAGEFTRMMYPRIDEKTTFKYPLDAVLPLQGIMSEEDLKKPAQRDINNDPCIIVIKNGMTTGTTVGRLTGVESLTREATGETSRELTIINYNNDPKRGPFSSPGDSGAIIANGRGEIAGLLTSGLGPSTTSDITYATPMFWIKERMEEHFHKVDFFPTADDLKH